MEAIEGLANAVMRGVAALGVVGERDADVEAACKVMRAELKAFILGEGDEYAALRSDVLAVGGALDGAAVAIVVANCALRIRKQAA